MGRALVLRDVDFSTNKLGTVTIFEPVPCTGISLSSDSLTFTKLGASTLTATLTPNDTTDSVTWATSDATVATVTNGVVTAVGLGTATITATCGSESETCSVSVSVTLGISDFETILYKMQGVSETNRVDDSKDYISAYGTDADAFKKLALLFADVAPASGYKALSGTNADYDDKYVFMIPQNATKIEVAGTGLSATGVSYANSTEQPTYSISGKGTKLVKVSSTVYVSNSKCVNTIPSDVTGLDSCIIALTFASAIEDIPSDLTVSFKEE